jgi:hypothetical protein
MRVVDKETGECLVPTHLQRLARRAVKRFHPMMESSGPTREFDSPINLLR